MHYSVLLKESIDALNIKPNGVYIDVTFGRGGHSQKILDRLSSDGLLIAFDKDLDAIEYANKHFCNNYSNFRIVHSSFTQLVEYCYKHNLTGKVDGIIADLGVSSPQLDDADRGFSFMNKGPLDMRMDTTCGQSAKDVLETLSAEELSCIFRTYGEEKFSWKIAKAIKKYLAEDGKLETTLDFANIIQTIIHKKEKKHPATRCFQGLRIFVNNELSDLEEFLDNIDIVLNTEARVSMISFHSLEDRIVKKFFTNKINPSQPQDRISMMLPQKELKGGFKWIIKMLKAGEQELSENRRSRSAVLRAVEKK